MTKITKAEIKELVDYFEGAGAFAAVMLVNETTVWRWLKRGMKPHRAQLQRMAKLLERKRRVA